MKSLCVIPARGGSKTVPGKNIKMIGGKPMIGFVIETVLSSNVFDKVILSTDSEEIVSLVKKWYKDIEVPFIRPAAFADDNTPLIMVAKHALEYYTKNNTKFDAVFSVQPTCPFTKPETLQKAKKTMAMTDCDSVVTITKIYHHHPFRAYTFNCYDSTITPLTKYTTDRLLQKQDRPDAYGITGGIFGRKAELLNNWTGSGFALGKIIKGIIVSQEEGHDIDTQFDMDVFKGLITLKRTSCELQE